MKLISIAAGVVAVGLIGVLASPQDGDEGDPAHIVEFKKTCRRAVGNNQRAVDVCRCMTRGMQGSLRNVTEYRLAGAIIKAIGQTVEAQNTFGASQSTARELLQTKFDKISKEFYGKVSLERKASVLQVATSNASSCDRAQPQTRR